jgi:TonB family protein
MRARVTLSLALAVGVVSLAAVSTFAQTPQGPQPIASGFGAGAYQTRPPITYPVLVKNVAPVYPAAAKTAGLEGDVELEAIVKADGTIGDVRVIKSLDAVMGCDDAAVAAASRDVHRRS